MRIRNLIIGDVRFQFKYGFYFLYSFLTIIYICLLFALPSEWREKATTILIFSDPAAMGMFFMGAIILLEKSQRVLNSIAVSPVKASEYIASKVISLGVISTAVGTLIAIAAHSENIFTVALGTFLGSIIFSLFGLIVAANISSLNQFLIATLPVEIFLFVPPIGYLFGYDKTFMLIHPGCILIRFINGNQEYLLQLILVLCLWIGLFYYIALHIIKKMFQRVGGVKL
ncbi:MAG: ABC-type transport system, multidrug-familypermease [Clostridiales bacterium]|jgi:fluoroquinolone transport system permease protein|nr:ABC-type transport system, multidrug-familypermease [Clostridiales bacterium]